MPEVVVYCCTLGTERKVRAVMEDNTGMKSDFLPSLYLTPPEAHSHSGESRRHTKDQLLWLERLEDAVRRLVGSEARLWLCADIAKLSVPDSVQVQVFMDFLRRAAMSSSSQAKRVVRCNDDNEGEVLVKQVVRMLCDNCARQVGRWLANDDKLLCRFFSGDPKRILGWFQNFAGAGEVDHRLGARALSRYAFMHREDYWHELEWKGKHSQAPATVASKPHYFSELDVLRTVDNFLEHVPSFWYSEELRDSLKEGEFLALDSEFFHDELCERMISDISSDVWLLVKEYLRKESFMALCHRTLHLMSDKCLLDFLSNLRAALAHGAGDSRSEREQTGQKKFKEDQNTGGSFREMSWLETVFEKGIEWETMYDACLSNACGSHWREMLMLVQNEDHEEEALTLNVLLSERGSSEGNHWRLRRECLVVEKQEAVKWLSLEAWLLFYILNQESSSPESLETLMTEVGTGFLRLGPTSSESYELISTTKEKRRQKRKRFKLRRRSRKRAQYSESDDSDSGREQVNRTEYMSTPSGVSWRLSVDNYNVTWTKVDVAEHLVKYAIKQWLQWVTIRW